MMLFKGAVAVGLALGGWLVFVASSRRRRRGLSISSTSPSTPVQDEEKIEIVGSSVNLPDMSATLNAKVTVSDQAQQDPRLMAVAYDSMAAKFASHGLNLPAVRAMRQYFTNLDCPGEAHPLRYANFSPPLPENAVRLCLVFFQRANPSLASLVYQAAAEVIAALPFDTKYHLNDPHHYHITVYMTSQPHTLRPSPLVPGNSLPDNLTPEELYNATKPTNFEGEVAVMRREAAATLPPTFRVHRLLMADSGTLLLCNIDASGVMGDLRKRLRDSFPGGPPRQSTIFHASVARVLGPEQMEPETVAKVQEVCDAWSDRLRGKEFKVEALHFVCEETFTTVEGPAVRLPFQHSGGPAT